MCISASNSSFDGLSIYIFGHLIGPVLLHLLACTATAHSVVFNAFFCVHCELSSIATISNVIQVILIPILTSLSINQSIVTPVIYLQDDMKRLSSQAVKYAYASPNSKSLAEVYHPYSIFGYMYKLVRCLGYRRSMTTPHRTRIIFFSYSHRLVAQKHVIPASMLERQS